MIIVMRRLEWGSWESPIEIKLVPSAGRVVWSKSIRSTRNRLAIAPDLKRWTGRMFIPYRRVRVSGSDPECLMAVSCGGRGAGRMVLSFTFSVSFTVAKVNAM